MPVIVVQVGSLAGSGMDDEIERRFIENHTATADTMGELTEAAGGTAWTSTNPWIMDRTIEPALAAIVAPKVTVAEDGSEVTTERTLEEIGLDVVDLAITFENVASATHQTLTSLLTEREQRLAVANASTEEARHSATLILEVFGIERRFSPALIGEEVVNTNGIIPRYAIETTFGSVAQEELLVGATDENGVRTSFLVATPAANSFIYEELEEA